MMALIREATSRDREAVRDVHRHAFPEKERQVVANLAIDLLNEEQNPGTLSLVAEIDGSVAGHIAFSPVTIESDDNRTGYLLAPLGVKPAFQKRRIGAALVENGIQRLKAQNTSILFVYGDPGYYGQFGFKADAASAYMPPYRLRFPFGWQAVRLDETPSPEKALSISCTAPLRDPDLW